MSGFSVVDYVALAFFALAWIAYYAAVERSKAGGRSLNSHMNHYRYEWMEQMVMRENRIVDTTIMASLQNGTAFFASTSLIAIGGVVTLFKSSEDVVSLFSQVPGLATTLLAWELKVAGLAVIFIYAFFKFAWAYRLFNYVAILVGSVPVLRADNHDERFDGSAARRPHERGRRPAFQPGTTGVLFLAGLSGLVCERVCVHRHDRGGAVRDVAAPIRLRCTIGSLETGMISNEPPNRLP